MKSNNESGRVAELKIDKDCFVCEEWLENYVKAVKLICGLFGLTVNRVRFCHSKKKGVHFYIHIIPAVDGELANQLQWLLGDDCCRVDFNRARIESGLLEWNKLFEEPERKLKTVYRV